MRFKASQIEYNGFKVIRLIDSRLNTEVEILSIGAILNKFSVKKNSEELNIIDGYELDNFSANEITPFFKSAKMCPFVGRLEKNVFEFGKENYTIEKYQLNNVPIHGLLFDASFEIINIYSNDSIASVTLFTEYDTLQDGFYFKFNCKISYELRKENSLSITTEIINVDSKLMPLADGWHHYFCFNKPIEELFLEFQSTNIFEFNNQLIPTENKKKYEEFGSIRKIENTQFDSCFEFNFTECQPLCVLRDSENKIQLEIHQNESYPYLQIYTPDHRQSIALEVMSSIPNSFTNGIGLKVLEPQESAIFTTSYIVRLY